MSDPQAQPKSEDTIRSIAVDFVRVLWSPTAVFRRRRATRARRVLFVLWLIITLVAIPVLLLLAVTRRPEDDGWPLILYVIPLATPVGAFIIVLLAVGFYAIALRLGCRALRFRLPMHRVVLIAALSTAILFVSSAPWGIALFYSEPRGEPAGWMAVLSLSLAPLAPESRPVLALLLSFFGIPAFWLATVHAIGAREMTGSARSVKFTAPAFWAASAAVTLIAMAVLSPIGKWAEEASRAAQREAAESADTTRAPATAP